MGVAVPTAAAVLSASGTEISAIVAPVALTNVFTYEQRFEAVWEDLEQYQLGAGDLEVVYIILEDEDALEGRGSKEHYAVYKLVATFYFIRVDPSPTEWKEDGDAVVTSIIDKIDGNAAIFAISGQRQLKTPETARARVQGFDTIDDVHGQTHKIYKAEIEYLVEARRWT